jgi:hypothetical protein
MIVLFRIQDVTELSANVDLATMLYSKMFENASSKPFKKMEL